MNHIFRIHVLIGCVNGVTINITVSTEVSKNTLTHTVTYVQCCPNIMISTTYKLYGGLLSVLWSMVDI